MNTTLTDDQLMQKLRVILEETFEIDPQNVTPEAHLFQDLGLDSIDAVDLAIKVQEITGKRIKPDQFRHVRTVGDVVTTARQLLQG